jgi:hypothetical protein
MPEKGYAVIKDYKVINLIVFDEPTDETLDSFKNFYDADSIVPATDNARIDGEYDGEKFWTSKPYESWIKNQEKNIWIAPVPYPGINEENTNAILDEANPKVYTWNEESLSWDEINVN